MKRYICNGCGPTALGTSCALEMHGGGPAPTECPFDRAPAEAPWECIGEAVTTVERVRQVRTAAEPVAPEGKPELAHGPKCSCGAPLVKMGLGVWRCLSDDCRPPYLDAASKEPRPESSPGMGDHERRPEGGRGGWEGGSQMKRLTLVPSGWLCTLEACPPGLFLSPAAGIMLPQAFEAGAVCLKTAYGAMETVGPVHVPGSEVRWTVGGKPDAYNSAGERFCGGKDALVQPLEVRWEEEP